MYRVNNKLYDVEIKLEHTHKKLTAKVCRIRYISFFWHSIQNVTWGMWFGVAIAGSESISKWADECVVGVE